MPSPATDLDPELAALRERAASSGAAPLVALSPREARERVTTGDRGCAGGPSDIITEQNTIASVTVRTYRAPHRRATLIYAHGGGWVTGDLNTNDELCRFLARDAAVDVISVDYRLAPEHPFPAAHDDVAAVIAAVEPDHGPLLLGGDSAGANLVLAASQNPELSERIAGLVLLYPALDTSFSRGSYRDPQNTFPIGAADMEWFTGHYATAEQRSHPRLNPGNSERLSTTPPTYLVTAGHDPLRDEGLEFAARLTQENVAVRLDHFPEMCHSFLRFTAFSEGARIRRQAVVSSVGALVAAVADDNKKSAYHDNRH